MHILPWAPTDDYEISHGEVGWSMFYHEDHMVTMRFLMVKREEPYFTMSITWWPCDFSWWDGRSHVSSWASRGDHEIFHGEDRGATFHHEHHVTTMRFLLVRWDGPCFIMSITWWPWDFSWWRWRCHISPWESHDDHEISHGEVGWVMLHNEHHVMTMGFLSMKMD